MRVQTPTGSVGKIFIPMSYLPDLGSGGPITKQDIEACMSPVINPDREDRIRENCDFHAQYLSNESSLRSLRGSEEGNTVVLIGSGPSAKGVSDRIDKYRPRGLRVCGLNLGTTLVHNPEYVACYERLAKKEWWEKINPDKTKLLAAPLAPKHVADIWRECKNVYYSWIVDMRGSGDPRWACIDPLISSLTTAVTALHALSFVGFKNILLCGFDFSIGGVKTQSQPNPDGTSRFAGQFYADGTDAKDDNCYVRHEKHLLGQGVNDSACLVNGYQYGHMLAMKSACEMLLDLGVNVVNCSGQGILFLERKTTLKEFGVDSDQEVKVKSEMDLEEALEKYLPEKPKEKPSPSGNGSRLKVTTNPPIESWTGAANASQ